MSKWNISPVLHLACCNQSYFWLSSNSGLVLNFSHADASHWKVCQPVLTSSGSNTAAYSVALRFWVWWCSCLSSYPLWKSEWVTKWVIHWHFPLETRDVSHLCQRVTCFFKLYHVSLHTCMIYVHKGHDFRNVSDVWCFPKPNHIVFFS